MNDPFDPVEWEVKVQDELNKGLPISYYRSLLKCYTQVDPDSPVTEKSFRTKLDQAVQLYRAYDEIKREQSRLFSEINRRLKKGMSASDLEAEYVQSTAEMEALEKSLRHTPTPGNIIMAYGAWRVLLVATVK